MKKKIWRKRGLPVALALLALSLLSGCEQKMPGKLEKILEERESGSKQELTEDNEGSDVTEEDDKTGNIPQEDGSIGEEPETGNGVKPENQENAQEQEAGQTGEQSGEGDAPEDDILSKKKEWVNRQMAALSLEEKIAQLFVLSPEALMPDYTQVTKAGEATRNALAAYPVGGLIYRAANLQNPEQTKEMLGQTMRYALSRNGIPVFLAVDEEGGRVARIGNNSGFSVEKVPPMAEIGRTGDPQKAYEAGDTIGAYLSGLGFNVDFAPDADVLSNPANTVIGDRSFGSDKELVAEMAMRAADGLSAHGVIPCVKHFPGHGCTTGDTHDGFARTDQDFAGFWENELLPFRRAAEQKIPMIMVSHISAPSITGSDTPASLSHKMVAQLLREQIGYQGVVITDDMGMGAIADHYGSGEAVVMAIEAGCDLILLSSDFQAVFEAVRNALQSGRLSEEQIETSVRRILNVKYSLVQNK